MPTDESVWRRDGARHVTVDVGPNVGVLATDQEYRPSWMSSLPILFTNRLVKSIDSYSIREQFTSLAY